jgi:hypothetical protein
MISRPPFTRSLLAVGCLFIGYGLLGLVNIIGASWNHKVAFDPSIFAIPLGAGILERRPAARKWALFATWIPAVGALIAVLTDGPRDVFGAVRHISTGLVLFSFVAYLVLAIWQSYVLTRPETEQQFLYRT